MWLKSVEKELLEKLVRESRCSHLSADLDGHILWASDEFCEWIGYSQSELKTKGWIAISKQDESLQADIEAAQEMKSGLRTFYTVEKAYVKKSGTPQFGVLAVRRVPEIGEFRFAWCHWQPLDGASDAAFSTAMKYQTSLETRIIDMTAAIKVLTTQSDEDKAVSSMIRMVQKYPKVCLGIVLLLAGSQGANVIVETLQKLGFIAPPKTELIVPPHATIPDLHNTPGLAFRQIVDADEQTDFSIATPTGTTITWSKSDGRRGSLSVASGRIRSVGCDVGTVSSTGSGPGGNMDRVRDERDAEGRGGFSDFAENRSQEY